MNGFINEKVLPPIMKFLNTKPMVAIKNGMIYPIPFIIVGSVFLILGQLPIQAAQDYLFSIGLGTLFLQINDASFGIMALIAAFGITYSWMKEEGLEGASAGLTAVIVHILLQPNSIANVVNIADPTQTSDAWQVSGIIDRTWLGGQGMILSIIVGLLVGWIFSTLVKKNITVKLPDSVPSNVAASFTALIPAAVVISLFGALHGLFTIVLNTTFIEWVYEVIQIPLQHAVDGPGGILMMGLGPVMWWFGVHGSAIISGVMGPLLLANAADNAALLAEGRLSLENGAHIVTAAMGDQIMTMSGAGITIGLLIFTLFSAKSDQMKSIGRLGAGSGVFNINEPVLFGMPVVLNPFLAIPFIFTPTILGLLTYFAMSMGIIPPFTGMVAPWTTPPILSGLLVGGWQLAIWQAAMLFLSIVIYWPFAKKYDNILLEQEAEMKKEN